MTITDFLFARIAEDEELARAAAEAVGGPDWEFSVDEEQSEDWTDHWWLYYVETASDRRRVADFDADRLAIEPPTHVACHDPARVLAECQAKRAIAEDVACGHFDKDYDEAVKHLAAVYADHPDYDETWRPT